MKKIILLFLIVFCGFTACKENNTYTLTGAFADDEQNGKTAYLQLVDSAFRRGIFIDSVTIEEGKFVFKGLADKTPVVQFVVVDRTVMPAAFIVEKGKINMDFDSENKAKVSGTAFNDKYQQFNDAEASMLDKIISFQKTYEDIKKDGDLTLEQLNEYALSRKEIEEDYSNLTYNFIKSNIMNPVGQYFFTENSYNINDSRLKELISSSTSDFKNLQRIKNLMSRVEKRDATAVGLQFTDVKGLNIEGKEISLSDYAGKGKIVLVDFWASWCGPCIHVMPELIETYNEFKNKGFEIVGISLDSNKDSWIKATEKFNISWPQLSNLKGWDEDSAVTYGINLIPNTILIDKDGKIIERAIHVDMLKVMLAELLVD